jgi:hypothetical protein
MTISVKTYSENLLVTLTEKRVVHEMVEPAIFDAVLMMVIR